MKAVQINRYGGSEVLEIISNAPRPDPGPDQVLIEAVAASLNPIDWKIRSGYLKAMAPLKFPATLGTDVAGIVIKVGLGVTYFKIGDAVYGTAIILAGGSGAFAEIVAANAKNLAIKPHSLNFVEAAALPLAGVSALQAIEDHIKPKTGQKILIHGGAGGIGSLAVQLVKAKGAYVATTVSLKNKEFVKQLGADEVIDYKTESFANKLKDYDAVFDMVGGETTNNSFPVLKKGGVIVSMVGQPDTKLAKQYGVTAIGQNTLVTTELLQRLSDLVRAGTIKPQVCKVFPLSEVKAAIDYLEKGSVRGKVVLKISD